MEGDLRTYNKFPPCAILVQGIEAQQLPETKKQPITPEQTARVKELYANWCKELADYRQLVLSTYGDSQPLQAITQTCEANLPPSTTIGQWLDRMILDFKAIQRVKIMVENEIRQKLNLEQYSFKLSEIDYISDIQNLLEAYVHRPIEPKKQSRLPKLPTLSTDRKIIVGLVAIIVVLIIVIIILASRENMYGPSDILVNRQELVKIATMPRPIPPTYSRWY